MKQYPVDILINNGVVLYRLKETIEVFGVTIPKDFVSDGATVPRFLWSLFPPVDDYFGASLLHDYLLHIGTDWKDAEQKFKKALEHDGISKTKIWLMVNAVRLNGLIKGKRK